MKMVLECTVTQNEVAELVKSNTDKYIIIKLILLKPIVIKNEYQINPTIVNIYL